MDQRARLRQGGLLIAIPCVIALAALTFMSPRFLGSQVDEFHSVWPAQRLLRGDVPYVDVFTHRPPVDILSNTLALAVIGETLTASRLLQVLSMVIAAYLLFALLRRWGASDWEAAGGAVLPTCLCFAIWPLPSAHWQSLPFALGAIYLLESARREGEPSSLPRLVAAGALAGLAGLTIQTEGAVACACLILRSLGGTNPRRELPLLLGGIALPVVLCAVVLLAYGILGAAFDCVVYFPLFNYKAGFNEVSFLRSVSESFSFLYETYGLAGPALVTVALALPLGTLAFGLGHLYRDRTRENAAGLAWLLVTLAVFFKGRADLIHLMFFLPYVLVVWFEFALRKSTPKVARRVSWAWLVLALLAGAGLLVTSWSRGIQPKQALWLDFDYRQRVSRTLSVLPPDLREAPLLSLPYGASYYFFREAEAPGIDWLLLPSQGYSLPEHSQRLATWLEEKQVPVVVLARAPNGVGFLREESALKGSLQNYQLYAAVGDRLVFVRKSVLEGRVPAQTPR